MATTWEVEVTDEFRDWWEAESIPSQTEIARVVALLEQEGPLLRRPYSGEIVGSANDPRMKELVIGHSTRILYVFDPRQVAILLLGGDKHGSWKAWYRRSIKEADRLYAIHLAELRAEGLL